MSTKTTHYNFYLPSGDDGRANNQPWGNQVNQNFIDIDNLLYSNNSYTAAYTGSVARTFNSKFTDNVTVKDLGLVGDMPVDPNTGLWVVTGATDNSATAYAMFTNHQVKKHRWLEGSYYCASGVTYNYDEVTGIYGITKRAEIKGEGKTNTHIVAGGPGATFTATASGTKLTLTSDASGVFAVGQIVTGLNIDNGTTIVSIDSGLLGKNGSTYTLSIPASINISSEAMATQVHGLGLTGTGYQKVTNFSGSVTGSTLTLMSDAVGAFALGDNLFGPFIPYGTTVVSKTSGTLGANGSVYALSASTYSTTGTAPMRTANRSNGSIVSLGRISDLALDNASGDHLTNTGLMLNNMSNIEVEDLMITGFGTGITYNGASGALFRNIHVNYATNGFLGISTQNISDNNLLLFDRVFFGNCTNYGIDMTVGTNAMFLNCDWEGCGAFNGVSTFAAGTGNSGAARITVANVSGMNGPVFENCYIEANNGAADIEIINLNASPITVTFRNCNFMRLSSTRYTTNCIKVSSPNGRCTVLLENCSFASAGTFESGFAGSSMWTKNPILHDANTDVIRMGCATNNVNMYGHTPTWTGTPGSFLPVRGGWVNSDGTYNSGMCDGTWTSTKIGTGHYRITSTSTLGFTEDPTGIGYLPWAMGTDATNSSAVQNCSGATRTYFDVYTGTSPSARVDCPFSWFLIKIV
jgi:hypothetical protein